LDLCGLDENPQVIGIDGKRIGKVMHISNSRNTNIYLYIHYTVYTINIYIYNVYIYILSMVEMTNECLLPKGGSFSG
jgi:hypothetical protein